MVITCASGAYLYSSHHFNTLLETARTNALAATNRDLMPCLCCAKITGLETCESCCTPLPEHLRVQNAYHTQEGNGKLPMVFTNYFWLFAV